MSSPEQSRPPGAPASRRALAHALAAERLRRLHLDLLSFSRALRSDSLQDPRPIGGHR